MKALIFDLDGTLIDSVYPHTLAWQATLKEAGLCVPAWEIHRHIGISGKLLVRTLSRQRHTVFDSSRLERLERRHDELYADYAALQSPLPGARELLRFLRDAKIAHGIATTGKRSEIEGSLRALEIADDTPVVDGSATRSAKPEPDCFDSQQRLNVEKPECLVVGDAVWDIHAARRAGILGVGLLSGGVSHQDLPMRVPCASIVTRASF